MSDSPGGRRGARKTAKKQKQIGHVAGRKYEHNEEIVEKFVDDLKSGRKSDYELGRVVKVLGHGYEVSVGGRLEKDAYARGLLRHGRQPGREAPLHIGKGRWVVVESTRASTEIVAVLSDYKAAEARRALRLTASSSEHFSMNRSSQRRRNSSARRKMRAAIAEAESARGARATKRKSSSHKTSSGSGSSRSWLSFF